MTKAEVIDVLRQHRISPTAQRVEIAHLLLCKRQHASAEQVLKLVNSEKNRVSKATVYNTLNLFARKGLLRELVIDPTKIFYDSNTSHHYHFYNVDTGELIDIDEREIDVQHLPKLPQGTLSAGVDVIIRVRSAA